MGPSPFSKLLNDNFFSVVIAFNTATHNIKYVSIWVSNTKYSPIWDSYTNFPSYLWNMEDNTLNKQHNREVFKKTGH